MGMISVFAEPALRNVLTTGKRRVSARLGWAGEKLRAVEIIPTTLPEWLGEIEEFDGRSGASPAASA
jgi:hypothetical protein